MVRTLFALTTYVVMSRWQKAVAPVSFGHARPITGLSHNSPSHFNFRLCFLMLD